MTNHTKIRLVSKKWRGNSLSRLLGLAFARLLSVSLWLISDQHILRFPSVVWGLSFPIPREESRTDINFPGQANNDVLSWGVLCRKSNDVNDYPGFSRGCYISRVNRRGEITEYSVKVDTALFRRAEKQLDYRFLPAFASENGCCPGL